MRRKTNFNQEGNRNCRNYSGQGKKIRGRLILAAAVLAAGLTFSVQADVRLGDNNEEVYELQRLLFETGWLFEQPDGVFGRNTEYALNNYKGAAGLAQNGIGDAEVIARLQADLNKTSGAAEGNTETEYPSEYAPPAYCTTVLHYGRMGIEFCEEHIETLKQDYALQETDTAESWHEAAALWESVINSLYNEWVEDIADADKLTILSQYGAWKAACEQQRAALSAVFPDDPKLVEQQMETMLKSQAVLLCGMRAGRAAQ